MCRLIDDDVTGTMKNTEAHKLDINKTLFDGMGPIKLDLFPDDVTQGLRSQSFGLYLRSPP
jgi:hypothetical protein